jgi:hypothetical protein
MKKLLLLACVCMSVFTFQSCSKDDGDDKTNSTTSTTGNQPGAGITFTGQGNLRLSVGHTFGNVPLQAAPATYTTTANDTVKITELRYYISHVTLTTAAGNKVNLENHNLLDYTPGQNTEITLQNVPAGTYTSISYIIGVDSVSNSSGAQVGDLDPSNGMFWTWNTGYVFFRLKGRYGASNNSYSFDIGGGNNRMFATHSLSAYNVSGTSVTATLSFDVSRVFNAPNVYDLKVDVDEIHTSGSPALLKLKPNVEGAFALTGVQ